MRFRLALSLGFAMLVVACSHSPDSSSLSGQPMEREPSAVKTPKQVAPERLGYVLQERTADFVRYSMSDRGDFLVSMKGFKSRPAAEGFCSVREGYVLADQNFPVLLAKAKMPLEEIRRSNAISGRALSRGRSGYVFWVKGASVDEEATFAGRFDHVLELYENCRTDCTSVGRLRQVNDRLVRRFQERKEPLAICVSAKLKQSLSSRD